MQLNTNELGYGYKENYNASSYRIKYVHVP